MSENAKNRQLLGYSNKFMLYMMSGETSFCLQICFELDEEVDPEAMESALAELLPLFPEFRVRVFLEDGKIVSEPNDQPVPLFYGIEQEHRLGSDETNGYLFYFAWEKHTLKCSIHHGLTDVRGLALFMRTLTFLYARKVGNPLSPEETEELAGKIRLSAPDLDARGKELLDPYSWFADDTVCPENLYKSEGACVNPGVLNPDENAVLERYQIEFSLSEFLGVTKTFGVSVAPLLLAITSKAFFRTEGLDVTRPVVINLPVDLRPRLGTDTVVNISDGLMVPVYAEDTVSSLPELCGKLKENILAQSTRENFIKIITDKMHMVQSFEEKGMDPRALAAAFARVPAANDLFPFSYTLTYYGNLNTGKGLDRIIHDIQVEGKINVPLDGVQAFTYNDIFRIKLDRLSDNGAWAGNMAEILRELGLQPKVTKPGTFRPDPFDY